ncbi:hypothetical protein [Pseudomonas fluorescens]|uniref:hypothetical protein n=1 Tax=Pseudomonas fluorescens TaxID=294 RepID=UPI001BEA9326|nr:hypothetical protein [Pseudomonas fluorescens]MBT2373486.1 hypothetical protein [Pseudomonas fluorescens]
MKFSSQFKSYTMQFHVLNEAMTREARKLDSFNGEDEFGNPILKIEMQGCGRGYIPNKKDPNSPMLDENMNFAIVKFDRETKRLYTAFPVSK